MLVLALGLGLVMFRGGAVDTETCATAGGGDGAATAGGAATLGTTGCSTVVTPTSGSKCPILTPA